MEIARNKKIVITLSYIPLTHFSNEVRSQRNLCKVIRVKMSAKWPKHYKDN